MLDFDDLDALERYALAPDTEARRQLLAVSTQGGAAVKPGQAYLAGLFALECGDLAGARDQVQRLKSMGPHSDYFRRLEALVALRSWSQDPAATCAFLQETCGAALYAPPPQPQPPPQPAIDAMAEGQQPTHSSVAASSLDPALYSDAAVLRKAVQLARGPGGQPAAALPELMSRTGAAAALSYNEEYGLTLSVDERLQLLDLGGDHGRPGAGKLADPVTALLSGTPQLAKLAGDALAAERGGAVEALLPYMTEEQLDELAAALPPGAEVLPALLGAAVRKMYGSRGAVAGVASAVDVTSSRAVAGTSYYTPLLTVTEATAIRRRVLQLCDRLRAQPQVGPERLAWLEARALLPLAETAVYRAVVAYAETSAAAAAAAADYVPDAAVVAEAATEAVGQLGRLLSCLAAQGFPGVFSSPLLARSYSPVALPPPPVVHLGPALPLLAPNTGDIVQKLLATLLSVSPDPLALFAAGGALAGALNPSVQARLLSEAMLTRGLATQGSAAVDWAAVYRDTGGDPAALSEAVELEVSGPEAASELGWEDPGEDVVLVVTHKAVKHISVLVYDVCTEAYYRQKGEEVRLGIDLEGIGATWQLELDLPAGLQPLQRCRRLVPLPQLKGRRGVWVVEVQGGGLHSRALVRRGGLAALVRGSPMGLALTLFREDGSSVADPRVWVDGRVYRPSPGAEKDGGTAGSGAACTVREVVVPYRAAGERPAAAVLVDGDGGGDGDSFASLMVLQHVTEEYTFTCGMHFEEECAAAAGRGGTAPLLLQPCLTIGGWPAPLELLQDVSLTVEIKSFGSHSGEIGGGPRRQVFHDWKMGDGLQAAVVQVRLPDRPACVDVTLRARLRRLAHGSDGEPDYQNFLIQEQWWINQSEEEMQETRDLYLTRGSAGNYLLRLLGRAGEPHPGVPVVVALTHAFSARREPALEATEWAPPAPETGDSDTGVPAAAGATNVAAAIAAGLVIRRTLVTDANGSIDLGHLYGITAVAASVEMVQPVHGGGSKGRRRYCWPLPSLRCSIPTGRQSSFGFIRQLLVRALASRRTEAADGHARVQCTIPCAATGVGLLHPELLGAGGGGGDCVGAAAAVTDPQQHQQPFQRLGLTLVSLAAAAAFSSISAKPCGPPAVPPLPPSAEVQPGDWDVTERLDERQYVTVRQGHIEVAGLPPGVYGLYVRRLGLAVTLLVYDGRVVGPAPAPADNAAPSPAVGAAAAAVAAGAEGDPGAAAGSGGGFVFHRGLIAPLSEPRPLQLAELRASVAEGVTARLRGSEEQLAAAVVVVVLSRFKPHPRCPDGSIAPLLARADCLSNLCAGVSFGLPPSGCFQSGRRLGDEVRYVLERRRLVAEGRVRPMPALVDRPSLLVQRWKVQETATKSRSAQRGEKFNETEEEVLLRYEDEGSPRAVAASAGRFGAPGCAPMGFRAFAGDMSCDSRRAISAAPMCAAAPGGLQQRQAGTLGLAFCPPAVVLANVPVGPDGLVHLSAAQLAAAVAAAVAPAGVRMSAADPWVAAGHKLVRLIAYTAPSGISAGDLGAYSCCDDLAAVEGAPSPSWADPRVTIQLQRPFPAGSICLERRSCHVLQSGSDLVIADAATAKLQLYGTVPKVWALYGSLLSLAPRSPSTPYDHGTDHASLWNQFSCVGGWMGLSSTAKLERYSQLACRELAFFCYCHDPEFFRRVVLPGLRARLPSSRCCLDSWLMGLRGRQLLDIWGAPNWYTKLTPLEQVLLAWEEDLLHAAAATGGGSTNAAPPPLPRLSRLAADMRARVRRRVAASGQAAVVAELKRRRYEIALNGPGHDSEEKDLLDTLAVASFEDVAGPPPPAGFQPAMVMAMAAPLAAPGMLGAPAQNRAQARSMRQLAAVREVAAAAPAAYRPPLATQEWSEAGWYRRPHQPAPNPDCISPESEFWADLAEHLSKGGPLGMAVDGSGGGGAASTGAAFMPRSLESGGWSFSDALLATAVVGVPWVDAPPLSVTHGTRLTITASTPTVAYVRQTLAAATTDVGAAAGADGGSGSGSLLVIQKLLDPNLDPSEELKRRRQEPVAANDRDYGDGFDDEAEEQASLQERDGVEVPPGSPLAYDRLYCYNVIVTNTGPSSVRMDVTVQAPQGAVPLGGRPALWVQPTEVQPFGARKLPPYFFYFPRPEPAAGAAAAAAAAIRPQPSAGNDGSGDGAECYDAFPAAASTRGKVLEVAGGQSLRLKVLPAPSLFTSTVDLPNSDWSWSRLAALPAGPEADVARLKYLEEGDLSGADLGLVLWRCSESGFWRAAVAALRRRRIWDLRLWSLAALHGDGGTLCELLPCLEPLERLLGPEVAALAPLLLHTTPPSPALEQQQQQLATVPATTELWLSAGRQPHLEYWPLVNPRAHLLGGKRATLNEALEQSWRRLLVRMTAVAIAGREPTTEDLLAAAYYLILQDRPLEARELVDRLVLRPAHTTTTTTATATATAATSSSPTTTQQQQELHQLQLCYLRAWLVLADPAASAQELSASAATVRQWCVAASSSDAAGGDARMAPQLVLEPWWQTRLMTMAAALEESAAAAAANFLAAGGGDAAGQGASAGAITAAEGGAAASDRGGGDGGSAGAAGKAAPPQLLLYDSSSEGLRGGVVLETLGVRKVTLAAHFMDLELLFSVSPFDPSLVASSSKSGGGGGPGGPVAAPAPAARRAAGERGGTAAATAGRNQFAILRPAWRAEFDVQELLTKTAAASSSSSSAVKLAAAAVTSSNAGLQLLQDGDAAEGQALKLLIHPHILIKQHPQQEKPQQQPLPQMTGAVLLEASAAGSDGAVLTDPLQCSLTCNHCDLRVVVRKELHVIAVSSALTGIPVVGAYVKVYVMPRTGGGNDSSMFHKDGYTDRRGLMDFWTVTVKPESRISSVALLVSHPELGSTVVHSEPPLH